LFLKAGIVGGQVSHVLVHEDLSEELNQTEPALVSPDSFDLNSYNQWQCFEKKEIETHCVDVCRGVESCQQNETEKEALISVLHQRKLMEFSLELPDSNKGCEEILFEWEKIMENQSVVCIYSAYSYENSDDQSHDFHSRSFWVLDKIKTKEGYWAPTD